MRTTVVISSYKLNGKPLILRVEIPELISNSLLQSVDHYLKVDATEIADELEAELEFIGTSVQVEEEDNLRGKFNDISD